MNDHLDTTNLVKHYFNICNTALAKSLHGPVHNAVVTLLDEFASGETIVLEVTGTAEEERPCYTTMFVDGQFTPIREGTHDPETRFELSTDFLEDVVRNADDYIEHPEKLDWTWLRPERRG